MRRAAAALVLGGVLALAAAARSDGAPASAAPVAIASFNFAPPSVEIDQGGAVEWTNLDAVVHTVTAERGEFASGHMRQGQRYSLTFTAPGRYQYFCETHDMRAESVVVPSGATSATAPRPRRRTAAGATQIAEAVTDLGTVASAVETRTPSRGVATPGAPLPAAAAVVVSGASPAERRDWHRVVIAAVLLMPSPWV